MLRELKNSKELKKIPIKQTVIVEGKCDRAVLESVIDAVIVPVNGFGVYKDSALLKMLRRYAETTGVILLTDSDNAGRQIRDYLKSRLSENTRENSAKTEIHHIYAPNLTEVEDTDVDILRQAFIKFENRLETEQSQQIDRQRLFDDGLIGGTGSAKKRKMLLQRLELPENLSVNALLDVINKCGLYNDYENGVNSLKF